MPTIQEFTQLLEQFAAPSLQESYDNSGLIVGHPQQQVTGILVALDAIESVVDEAVEKGCNLIIVHHPIVFGGLKKLNGKTYVERTVMAAIKQDVAIYAIHTNLDNVLGGVNTKIAEKLGLTRLRVLRPKTGVLRKLVTFCPAAYTESVRSAMFDAGAGAIGNYSSCSFTVAGSGTFLPMDGAQPVIGEVGTLHMEHEDRVEVLFESWKQSKVLTAMCKAHPYEKVAYDIYQLENEYDEVGSGIIGELTEPTTEVEFLQKIKKTMMSGCVRHTKLLGTSVKTVAVCGGSGSFLLNDAKKAGADVFVTADFKYHEFFDAEGKVVVADIGHYESEQFTIELIRDLILEKFPTFAVRLTGVNTNPVGYL